MFTSVAQANAAVIEQIRRARPHWLDVQPASSLISELNEGKTLLHAGPPMRWQESQHTIITEESGELEGTDQDVQWVIDPLDGTTNFIKRLPHFAVSIAVRIKGRTEVAVVYDPMRNELFTATRGQGAQLNGYRLRGSTARDLDGTILATGFPFKAKQYATTYINIVGKLFNECADFRRTGSAALDLAYVAAGRVDGFFEIGLRPWDFAAGELLVREAGGIVSDFTGGHNYMLTGNIVAGNPRVVKAMLANMRDELSDALKR